MELMVFSKHLAGLPLGEVARRLKSMDIGAIDLTLREGGHVEPSRVEEELRRVVEELALENVRIGQITTGITDIASAHAASTLEAAAKAGVRFWKLGYFGYKEFGSLRVARHEARAKVRDLAQASRDLRLCGGFHNHSHRFIGACVHDIDFILEGTDPSAMGLYFDPAHATIEGGSSGWEMGLDLLRERVVMLAVKDFAWLEGGGYAGARRFGVQWCPLESGNVAWPQVLERLHRIGYDGPISLHSEYQGASSFRDLSTEEVLEQTARDAEVFRGWARVAGLNL